MKPSQPFLATVLIVLAGGSAVVWNAVAFTAQVLF